MSRYPFAPELLDALPENLAELFRALEITLLDEICSRLKLADQLNEVTVQDIRALRSHGIDLDDIEKAIRETTGISQKKLDQLLNDVVERNQAYYTELIDIADVTAPERLVDVEDTWAIYEQTKHTLTNFTQSMGFLVDNGRTMLPPAKAYQWALDSAEMQIKSGAISYNQAVATAVKQLADSGLCVIYDKAGNPIKNMVGYESGHKDQLDVAVRRAVMSGVNQINQKYREQSMDYLETDLVETSAHLGARNIDGPNGWENHEKWQGRVFRWEGKNSEKRRYVKEDGSLVDDETAARYDYEDFEKACGYGSVTGIVGANCRHSFWPFIEGVMERTYTDEQLEDMKAENHQFTYEGKEYDGYKATQQQRKIERTIRKLKREKAAYHAAGLTEEEQTVSIRLRRLNAKYKDFSAAAGLPEQKERMKVLY